MPTKRELNLNYDFIKFSENLRRTATGVKFVQTLFTNPDKFSPKQITLILRNLGLDIPREVEMGAQLAQIIISGNNIYQSYQDIETVRNADSLNQMSGNTALVAINLMGEMKWIDKDQATLLRVGTDIAMIIASAGTDVRAWISLGLEVGLAGGGKQAEAKFLASQAGTNWYRENMNAQAIQLQSAVQKLSDGEIGLFGFISEASYESSMLFDSCVLKNPKLEPILNLLPTLKLFPLYNTSVEFSARTTTWYGEGHRDQFNIDFISSRLAGLSKQQQIMMIFDVVFKPLLSSYTQIQNNILSQHKCSLMDYSKLIALDNQNFYLEDKLDIQDKFKRQFLTPSDLGLNLFDSVVDKKDQYALRGFFNFMVKEPSAFVVKDADKQGFISPVLKNSQSRKIVDDYFNYGSVPFPDTFGKDSRNMANFIAYLDMVDMIKSDPYLKTIADTSFMDDYLKFGGVDEWRKDLERLTMLTTVRKVNRLARENIASFLKIDSSKLVKIDDNKTDTPSVFRIKGN